ncbi:hydantoinase/oxoprolinase family protein [Ruegeria sp. 2205SS24-7]|uniref:hydantoinase/oxoprolinase family protein n=1 Tax=Ruegeria discodermiae TaxID=3064389 RepID=UPI002742580F|nr:hydantoinase/oxoprolinase family protein [Ruegeria sp. 2205SS24-7]MDP5217763.1 hydantoinase/oxoprolinase family protein [Ruegeria sp. 2205SS24-7]
MTGSPRLRLAIDIGGTFTDTVLVSGEDRIVGATKTLTTHGNPAEGAMQGAQHVLAQAGHDLGDLSGFIHGTTLATNALIEKRGARVATITTEGFRDILEIAYERRYAQYDLSLEKPDFLVPRDRAFTIPERMAVDGKVLRPIDETAVDPLVKKLEASGVEAVAICLLHSYANPSHEHRLRALLRAKRPDLTISISSDVSPEAREFDRLSTTVANAYIQPLMASYLDRLQALFKAQGLQCPILMMTAGGGMCTLETARRFPIRLVESGPAGGAVLAAHIAAQAGLDQVLSLDVGGTTAKLCLIDKAQPQSARQFEIGRAARFIKGSGMPVRIPVIEMIEIGAGGGSIAAVDRLGRLTVGPKSAGSEPGPAAFGRGGIAPTVTDADIELGFLRPEGFAEGRIAIDPAAARAALADQIGAPLDLKVTEAADGVSRIVQESMASAARMHAVESGKDLSSRILIAFGGNGPLHAGRVARSAGVTRILIPPNPGVGSAVGFLFAPVSFEIVRSRYAHLESMDLSQINKLFDEMMAEAGAVVAQGAGEAMRTTQRSAFMRYGGQGHEIEIALPDHALTDTDLPDLISAFEGEYSRQFSRPVPGMTIEILNWSVRVFTDRPAAKVIRKIPMLRDYSCEETTWITSDLDGTPQRAAHVARADLRPGDLLHGPALITEPQTTTLVSSDFTAQVDAMGNLVLTRRPTGGVA